MAIPESRPNNRFVSSVSHIRASDLRMSLAASLIDGELSGDYVSKIKERCTLIPDSLE